MAFPVMFGLILWGTVVFASVSIGAQAPIPSREHRQPAPASAPPKAAAQTVITEPEISLTLVDPDEKLSVWRDTRIQFSVKNGSLPSGIGITSATLSIPSAMALTAVGKKASDGTLELIPEAIDLRDPGERRDFFPVELKGKRVRDLGWGFLSLLLYRPRNEVFLATLKYEDLKDRKSGTRTGKLVVNVTAHPIGMYAGAVLGSLLIALFLSLPPLRSPAAAPPAGTPATPPLSPAQRVRDFTVRFVRGSVVAGIAVLILQTTSEFALPVNITVHDFYGGVLLGLFGDKVAAAILKWIGAN